MRYILTLIVALVALTLCVDTASAQSKKKTLRIEVQFSSFEAGWSGPKAEDGAYIRQKNPTTFAVEGTEEEVTRTLRDKKSGIWKDRRDELLTVRSTVNKQSEEYARSHTSHHSYSYNESYHHGTVRNEVVHSGTVRHEQEGPPASCQSCGTRNCECGTVRHYYWQNRYWWWCTTANRWRWSYNRF